MMIDTDINDKIIKEQTSKPLVSETQTDEGKAKVGKSRKQMSCFKCHQKGHMASFCPNKKHEAPHQPVTNEKTLNVSSKSVDKLDTKSGLGIKPVNAFKRDIKHSVSTPKPKRQDNSMIRDREPSRFRTPSRNHSQFDNGSTSRTHELNYGNHNRIHGSVSRRFSSKIRDNPSQ